MRYDWHYFKVRNGGEEGARAAFERACVSLLRKIYPEAKQVRANPGDDGVDVYVGEIGIAPIVVYQCKFHLEQVGKSQKAQIRSSFQTAIKSKFFKMEKWVLCLPKVLDMKENRWWTDFRSEALKEVAEVELLDGDCLLGLVQQFGLTDLIFDVQSTSESTKGELENIRGLLESVERKVLGDGGSRDIGAIGSLIELFTYRFFNLLGRNYFLQRYLSRLENELDLVEQPILRTVDKPPRRSEIYIDQKLRIIHQEQNQKIALKTFYLSELDEVFGGRIRLLLTGEAGDGKSTVLKEYLRRTIERSRSEKFQNPARRQISGLIRLKQYLRRKIERAGPARRQIPVFIRLGTLFGTEEVAGRNKTKNVIFDAMVANLQPFFSPSLPPEILLEEARSKGELVVALDGLDECVNYETAVREIRQFCKSCDIHNGNVIIVTCRSSRLPTGLSEVLPLQLALEPLTSMQIDSFLDLWPRLSGRLCSDLKAKLSANADIRAFCTNPLILTLVVHLFLEGATDGATFAIPPNRVKLYDRVFKELLLERRENRGIHSRFPPWGKRIILRQLAFRRFEQSQDDPEHIKPADLALAIQETMKGPFGDTMGNRFHGLIEVSSADAVPRLTELGNALLDELQIRDGVLIAHSTDQLRGDGRPTIYKLSHRSLLEFLAAEHAASVSDIRPETIRDRYKEREFNLLLFYSALARSPECIISLTNGFRGTNRYLKRARLLANAEALNADVGKRISDTAHHLTNCAVIQHNPALAARELQVLVAMASRQHDAFEPARQQLRVYLETLSGRHVGYVEFEGIIRAYPDPLLGILYELRGTIEPVLRIALVRGLAEQFKSSQGSLALRKIVGFLQDGNPEVRQEAAAALTRAVKEIPALAKRLCFDEAFRNAPETDSSLVWPLGKLFPRNVAYRIVEAAQSGEGLALEAFVIAKRALTWGPELDQTRKWRLSYLHLQRDELIRRLESIGVITITTITLIMESVMLCLAIWGASTSQAYQFDWGRGFRVIPAEATREVARYGETTQIIIEQVRKEYPQAATRAGPIDNVPRKEAVHFEKLKQLALSLNPKDRLTHEDQLSIERLGGYRPHLWRLDQIEANLDPRWVEGLNDGWRVPACSVYSTSWFQLLWRMLGSLVLHLLGWYVITRWVWEIMLLELNEIKAYHDDIVSLAFLGFLFICLRGLVWQGCSGDGITQWTSVVFYIFSILFVRLSRSFLRPHNNFIEVVREFQDAVEELTPDKSKGSPTVLFRRK